MVSNLKISGTGCYVPAQRMTAEAVDARLGLAPGWTLQHTGVRQRFFVEEELSSDMAAHAARRALHVANMNPERLDVIVCASAVPTQAIPCTASLVQKQLGLERSGIACMDLNATCVSFIAALDMVSCAMTVGRYQRALIVSSDISSVAINWEDAESAGLFGDGAAAVVVEASSSTATQGVYAARLETYSYAGDACEIIGGGTRLHPRYYSDATAESFLFRMDGPRIYKQAARHAPAFIDRLLATVSMTLDDIDCVVPHQASFPALELMRRRLGLPPEKVINIVQERGNCVAASIPMALHEAIRHERIVRGDRVLLFGTAAGMALAGAVLEY